MTALAEKPSTATATATSWAVRVPGRDGEPVYLLCGDRCAAETRWLAWSRFYKSGGKVVMTRVRIIEIGEVT